MAQAQNQKNRGQRNKTSTTAILHSRARNENDMTGKKVRIEKVDLEHLGGQMIQEGVEIKRISDGVKDTKGLNISIVSFEPGKIRPWNNHAQDQYVYSLRGKGIIVLDDEEIEVEQGMIALIPANVTHKHRAAEKHEFVQLSIIGGEKIK